RARCIEIEHREPATFFGKAMRDRPSDAAAATGDHGDLILQSAECHAVARTGASAHVLTEFRRRAIDRDGRDAPFAGDDEILIVAHDTSDIRALGPANDTPTCQRGG